MRSGSPQPIDDLKLLIETKRNAPSQTVEVVSEASRWLKAALQGAGIDFAYASCEAEDHYGFSAFTIIRSYQGERMALEMKIAEIQDMPYVFAEVRSLGKHGGTLFPFFGDMRSDEGRQLLLHYVADFVLSSEA
jgi:hypothetical protein